MLIGASGTIGTAVKKALSAANDVIAVNHTSGDFTVDLGNPDSIKSLFGAVGAVDAIVCTAGLCNFAPLSQLSTEDYDLALNNKLMGQINLLRFGLASLNPGGSVTLTSGTASREPMLGTSVISMATAALESFVKAAALELDTLRLNVVVPSLVKESAAAMGWPTDGALSAENTAKAYVSAVNGSMHGESLLTAAYA